MIFTIKRVIVYVLYGTGVLHLWLHVALRRRAVVLMYHRVLSPEASALTWSHPAIIVSTSSFERQIQFITRYFQVLSAEQFEARLSDGRFPPRSCLVTFDDGWVDNYTDAWPVLRKYHVPALVFLPTRYIGTGEVFWQERLGSLLHDVLRRARTDGAFAAAVRPVLRVHGLEAALDLLQPGERGGIMALVRGLKGASTPDPAAPIRAIQALVADDTDRARQVDAFINWDQARQMAADGISFGAHGHTHRLLTTLRTDEVSREIETSREGLRSGLGIDARVFCYPNGDWNTEVAEQVAAGKFSLAFSTDQGHVGRGANRYAVRRMNISERVAGSTPLFLARVLGLI